MQLIQTEEDMNQSLPKGHPNLRYQQPTEEEEYGSNMDLLSQHIQEQWEINKHDRIRTEQEMLDMQEATNNKYDASTLSAIRDIGGSQIFIPLTSMQSNTGAAWINNVLMPAGDKAFTFKPTPVPELPQKMQMKIQESVKASIQQGAPKAEGSQTPGMPQGMPAGPDGSPITPKGVSDVTDIEMQKVRKGVNKEAAKRAEKMEAMVQDQLLESGWYKALEEFVIDLVTFPTAFIKTTYYNKTTMSTTSVNGNITMESSEKLVVKDERVSPFDIYPSPDQTNIDDGSLIERLKMSRNEIYKCLDKPGYSNDNILKVLDDVDGGGFAAWQSNVDSMRRYAENHTTSFSGRDGSVYGLRFLGYVSVDKLLDWGYSVEDLQAKGMITEPLGEDGLPSDRDRLREIDIDAILVGAHVIKAVPNQDPEGKRPYFMASYRNVPGSFWGKSIAMLASSHQRMVNATARALSNNMGIASGPQIVVYTDRLPNGESLQSIRPLKIWQTVSDPAGSNAKPFDFFQPQSNAKELMAVYQYYFDSVGEVTGVPRSAYGGDQTRTMPGAQTASGMAMIMETASKQIKQSVRNIDSGVIEPRLKYQYRTNMMDPEVPNGFKGDMSIQAIGAKSIVAKSVENQRAIELLQATANPMDAALMGETGRAEMLRLITSNYDMPGVIATEEELEDQAKKKREEPPKPTPEETKLEIEKIRSETRLKDQELEMQLAQGQQKADLQIANLELQRKQIDAQIAITNNQENNAAKMKEIALRESNSNARFQSEMAAKAETGTGI